MTREQWDQFVDENFVGPLQGLASDFYAWLRLRDCCPLDYDVPTLTRYCREWSRSGRRGRHDRALDRRRRRQFGPGKYWAPTSAGVYLNKQFVKGWRGINPANP